MAEDRYVLLTGSKNNAGDFLIASRAKELLAQERSDRDLIEYPRWEPLTEEKLEIINASKALLLTGGPALQYELYPGIYPLVPNLEDIHVPLIMMGIGYKCHNGSWKATRSYELSRSSLSLLDRIEQSGFLSGVRDYRTLNVLFNKGYSNFLMTGCPGLYDMDHLGVPFPELKGGIERSMVFSVGVLSNNSSKMLSFTKDLLLKLQEACEAWGWTLRVAFHHRIRIDHPSQQSLIDLLKGHNIEYQDVSGTDEHLRKMYGDSDIHVGFRVHAHLFMSSLNKPSVLLSEDGRAKGMRDVMGGMIFDPYTLRGATLWDKALMKARLLKDRYIPEEGLPMDLLYHLSYELLTGGARFQEIRPKIDRHFRTMKQFLEQLP